MGVNLKYIIDNYTRHYNGDFNDNYINNEIKMKIEIFDNFGFIDVVHLLDENVLIIKK